MILGIDTHNLRSGGGKNYIIELVNNTNPDYIFFKKIHIWGSEKLLDRNNDNRIFNSPAASDVDGDGLIDFVIDGAVYSADLADLTLKSSDIIISDSDGNLISEIEY